MKSGDSSRKEMKQYLTNYAVKQRGKELEKGGEIPEKICSEDNRTSQFNSCDGILMYSVGRTVA